MLETEKRAAKKPMRTFYGNQKVDEPQQEIILLSTYVHLCFKQQRRIQQTSSEISGGFLYNKKWWPNECGIDGGGRKAFCMIKLRSDATLHASLGWFNLFVGFFVQIGGAGRRNKQQVVYELKNGTHDVVCFASAAPLTSEWKSTLVCSMFMIHYTFQKPKPL